MVTHIEQCIPGFVDKLKHIETEAYLDVKAAKIPDFRSKQQKVDWRRFEWKPYPTLRNAALLLNIAPLHSAGG
ncbi:hypothetical protein COR50_01300 [Chitinophaga caeni]|uniref:Uncharacterized protein n=2 Tax=Chitinophaga caeni TaxID=2029983 RepID=A0A291QPQ9_9BACT|nr:hypothetical protein COR50_01300 [Chitinophaga caeni]